MSSQLIDVRFEIEPAGTLARIADLQTVTRIELENAIYAGDSSWIQYLTVTGRQLGDVEAVESLEILENHDSPDDAAITYLTSRVVEPDPFVITALTRLGSIPSRVFVEDGQQYVQAYVRDISQLHDLEDRMEQAFDGFHLRRTVHVSRLASPLGRGRIDHVLQDELPEDQYRALATAYQMGYFEIPQRATSTEVAEAIDAGQSTFSQRIHQAQQTLFEHLFSRHTKSEERPLS